MRMDLVKPVRIILIATHCATSRAAALARESGALVTTVDSEAAALDQLRRADGDLVMMDVDRDVPAFVARLRSERIHVPVLACAAHIGADALVHANGARLKQVLLEGVDELPVERLVGHTVAEVERELILQTLDSCGGNRTSASSILGISVRTLRNKLKTFVQAGISISSSH